MVPAVPGQGLQPGGIWHFLPALVSSKNASRESPEATTECQTKLSDQPIPDS